MWTRATARPVVDLPQPDSPTRPSVSPGGDVEAHVGHGLHAVLARAEFDHQVLDAQQHVLGAQLGRAAAGHQALAPGVGWAVARCHRGNADGGGDHPGRLR